MIWIGGKIWFMGTWGTGLYSNDVAEDVREACKDIYAFLNIDSGTEKIFDIFSEYVCNSNMSFDVDNETASFWYALADWQWNHGILSATVKNRAISLLNEYAGLSEWIESGNVKDVCKRKSVMDSLKSKLESEQSDKNIPQVKLKKAKHNPGDIVVFKTCQISDDEYQNLWVIDNLTPPFIFKSEKLFNSKYEDISAHDAHGKYMALLCIGKEKVRHSDYLNDVFDEYSVYVWYDYENINKPTIDTLKQCGFLTHIRSEFFDYNSYIMESIGWEYAFILMTESFRSSKKCYELLCVEKNLEEVERFEQAMAKKDYLKSAGGFNELYSSYSTCWQEKIRAQLADLSIDTLISEIITNPELLSVERINNAYKKWRTLL